MVWQWRRSRQAQPKDDIPGSSDTINTQEAGSILEHRRVLASRQSLDAYARALQLGPSTLLQPRLRLFPFRSKLCIQSCEKGGSKLLTQRRTLSMLCPPAATGAGGAGLTDSGAGLMKRLQLCVWLVAERLCHSLRNVLRLDALYARGRSGELALFAGLALAGRFLL